MLMYQNAETTPEIAPVSHLNWRRENRIKETEGKSREEWLKWRTLIGFVQQSSSKHNVY